MTTPTSTPIHSARARTLGPGLARPLPARRASPTGSTSRTLPVTIKILLENLLRHAGGGDRPTGGRRDAARLAAGRRRPRPRSRSCPPASSSRTSPASPRSSTWPSCATRWPTSAATRRLVNPLVPADLVIDHSVQVDRFGTPGAFAFNVEREYERNGERYQLLRWAQTAFRDLRVVPPGTGIVHQVNLEFLATVVTDAPDARRRPGRLPRHARRHRLAHDDGQRPRRPGLRRRRHRGRGRPARPAALPADAARRRRAPPRRAAARLDRDRPRPGRDRDAARARRRRRVRRVRRRRPGQPGPRRPGDDQQHEPRVRGDLDALPDRRRDARLPAPDRALGRAGRPGRALRQGRRACGASPATGPTSTSCSSSTSRASSRPWPGRAGRRTACRCSPARELPVELPERAGGSTALAARSPSRRRRVEEASAESFPASDPPSFASGDAASEAAPPAEPVVADAPRSTPRLPAGRDRDRRPAGRRSGPARSRSRRSPPAPTPRTRR